MKHYKHFQDPAVVEELLGNIRGRHCMPVSAIVARLSRAIYVFYEESFQGSGQPDRFQDVDSSLVRPQVLIGLSGGIDSTVVTYLATRALGKSSVLPVTMPAYYNDCSIEASRIVREALGFNDHRPYVIDIQNIIEAHMSQMCSTGFPQLDLGWGSGRSREQLMRCGNFGSRVRVGVLYDLQRAIRGRILGTSNRTEYCQGYSTKFGTPISYDFGVLDELYKVEIYEIAKYLEVPQSILDAAPTTGYFEGQTHEGELGATIEEQDIFAYLLFEKGCSSQYIANKYGGSLEFGRTMERRWKVSKHKRELMKSMPHAKPSDKEIPWW